MVNPGQTPYLQYNIQVVKYIYRGGGPPRAGAQEASGVAHQGSPHLNPNTTGAHRPNYKRARGPEQA
jgi:hypothetical protein